MNFHVRRAAAVLVSIIAGTHGVLTPLRAQLSFSFLDGLQGASAVSLDGSTVVGTARTQTYPPNAARWTAATGAQILPTIPGIPEVTFASAAAVSKDGSVVAGTYSYGTGTLAARTQAFPC